MGLRKRDERWSLYTHKREILASSSFMRQNIFGQDTSFENQAGKEKFFAPTEILIFHVNLYGTISQNFIVEQNGFT
jgi:hypothetical protein